MAEEREDRARQIGERLQGIASELGLSGRMATDPYPVLGMAAGIGYLAGGGLFSRLSRPLARAALGWLLVPRARARAARAAHELRSALFTQAEAQA